MSVGPGRSAAYYIVTATGEGVSVPVWMTEKAARELRDVGCQELPLRALGQLAGLES